MDKTDYTLKAMIPEPDYDSDEDRRCHVHLKRHVHHHHHQNEAVSDRLSISNIHMDKDGLVVPRKPPNPCAESIERRDLHRELLFNQKMGKNVLNQKSELQKAMQKHREHQNRKELEQERLSSRSTLEKALEQRARRLEELERNANIIPEESSKSTEPNEFLRMHAKLRGRVEATPVAP